MQGKKSKRYVMQKEKKYKKSEKNGK